MGRGRADEGIAEGRDERVRTSPGGGDGGTAGCASDVRGFAQVGNGLCVCDSYDYRTFPFVQFAYRADGKWLERSPGGIKYVVERRRSARFLDGRTQYPRTRHGGTSRYVPLPSFRPIFISNILIHGTAKRFHVQILLSIDLPPATHLLDSSAGMPGGGVPGMDPLGDKLYLGLERALVRVLDKALA
jgi:hypothetical protein